ncbi:hypothetical protein [Bradyrhizobium sp. McL0615]|uniref:hypothetical protein n=1 Tax=Bradyrhizobium sp. McL0615 TaxID=3415673 RepID=UPI003CF50965
MSIATNDNLGSDFDRGKSGSGVIEVERKSDWDALNRSPFTFRHHLEHHPLFAIPRLVNIAESAVEKRGPRNVYVPDDPELKNLPWKQRLPEAVRRIEGGSLWLKISQLQELHSDYRDLLQDILAQMEDFSGLPLRRTVTWAGLTVFIASPNVVTPYHFDHDTNFLFQIRGEKDVYLFDRSVVLEQEIEHFYAGDLMAGKFREGMIDKSGVFHLAPGTAVHHPPLAPHLIKNADNVSISLSMFYADRFLDERARTYQANYCMRRLGLRPRPPGQDPFRDRLKSAAINIFSKSHPKTQDDILYSGIRRVLSPRRGANRIVKRALHGAG